MLEQTNSIKISQNLPKLIKTNQKQAKKNYRKTQWIKTVKFYQIYSNFITFNQNISAEYYQKQSSVSNYTKSDQIPPSLTKGNRIKQRILIKMNESRSSMTNKHPIWWNTTRNDEILLELTKFPSVHPKFSTFNKTDRKKHKPNIIEIDQKWLSNHK